MAFRSRSRSPSRSVFRSLPGSVPRSRSASIRRRTPALAPLAWSPLWLALAGGPALAQTAAPGAAQTITITGRSTPSAAVGGFGDVSLLRTPLQAQVITPQQLRDLAIDSLADVTRTDASIADAYNAEGYWSFLSVRGFTLDNRFNYRRDGLPINAETALALDAVDRIEVLKGTSGMQAGTSAPGGLVNLVVKRPTGPLRSATLGARQGGGFGASVDLGQRFGEAERFGLRLNASAQHLESQTRATTGERHLLAAAADWRVAAGTLLEAEFELSHQSQPSVPGFSLLGTRVPDAGTIDPRINLNNQPWSLPVVFDGRTGSLRLTQALAGDWQLSAHATRQSLRTDDRLAFPFGCSAENRFDRYCGDGSFDVYDFQSDDERRTSSAGQLALDGSLRTGALTHHLSLGLLATRYRSLLQPRVDDGTIVGTGTIDGLTIIPTLPALGLVPNTNLSERSTELYLRDRIEWDGWGLWAGLRHSRLHRDSVRTDGSRPTSYAQSFTTPWLALSWQATPRDMIYASWGEGVESEVAPNKAIYANRGEPLPSLKSRQLELGAKHAGERFDAALTLFDLRRPRSTDIGSCDVDASCRRAIDGQARHRGVEASLAWRGGPWQVDASAMLLRARNEGATADPGLNGLRPTNVPRRTLKLAGSYELAARPGLALTGALLHEGERVALPDNSASIPGWTRVDLGARYLLRSDGLTTVLRATLQNAAGTRAWRESPYQFGHAYLYPLAPRTLRITAQFGF